MIFAPRHPIRTMQRVVALADPNDPDSAPVMHEERALVFNAPGYGQGSDGRWFVKAPGGAALPVGAKRTVTEHEDGTITVAGPPFRTALGAFRLEKGFFVPLPPEEKPAAAMKPKK